MGAFWRTVTQIDKSKINSKWMASRNALAVAVPLGIGIAVGKPLGAVAIATGALNVCYSDGRDPYQQRARRILTWTFLGAAAVFVGSVTGKYHFGAILIAAIWAFLGGMCIAISTRAGDLGLNTLVTLIVFAARGAMPLKGALISAGLVLSGGLLQTGFALLFWPLRRYSPERRAIGQLYLDVAKDLDSQSDSFVSGSLKRPSPQLQDTLAALERYHSIEGERFRMLFDQADRIRLSVILLDRIRSELRHTEKAKSNVATDGAECITQLIGASSKLLNAVAQSLISGQPAAEESARLEEVSNLVECAHVLQDGSGVLAAEVGSAADTLGWAAPRCHGACQSFESRRPERIFPT